MAGVDVFEPKDDPRYLAHAVQREGVAVTDIAGRRADQHGEVFRLVEAAEVDGEDAVGGTEARLGDRFRQRLARTRRLAARSTTALGRTCLRSNPPS